MALIIRRIIVAVLLIALAPGFAPVFFSGGGGAFTTSFAIANDSGSTMAAGTPTQVFGMVFPANALCNGAAPVFKDGSTVLKYSFGLLTYDNAGCVRHGSFMLIPANSVAGNGSQTITMTGGGAWPSASSRTITEVYTQAVVANAPPAGSANGVTLSTAHFGANLTGTWSSWLDSAANTNSNNYKVVTWLDGDAGKAYRVSTNMAQTKTGTAHSQLRFDHYVVALNNSSGTLGGFRWMGAIRQPKYNPVVADQDWRAFEIPDTVTPSNGVNWSHNGGSTIAWSWTGSDSNPITALGFTSTSGQNVATFSTTNNLYTGADNNCGGNAFPAYFKGSIPASTINGTTSQSAASIAYITVNPSDLANGFRAWGQIPALAGVPYSSNNGGLAGFIWNASAAGTIVPVPLVMPRTRLWNAETNGRYNFFQGTGTLTSETTLRVTINQSWWQASGMIPPFDLGVSSFTGGISNGSGGAGNILNVTAVASGTLELGETITAGASANTAITEVAPTSSRTGNGGTGTYTVNGAAQLVAPGTSFTTAMLGASVGGQVPNTAWNFPYHPLNIGSLCEQQQQVGVHPDLGIVPNDVATDFYNQTLINDRLSRTEGLSAGLTGWDFKDATTDNIANVLDTAGTSTYTGLPNSVATTVSWGSYATQGVADGDVLNAGSPGPMSTVFDQTGPSHRPRYVPWAYLRFGELQYADMLAEMGNAALLAIDVANRNPPSPAGAHPTVNGIVVNFTGAGGDEGRAIAWNFADLAWAAALYPYDPTNTATVYTGDGQVGKYLHDALSRNTQFVVDSMNPTNSQFGSSTSYITTRGNWMSGPSVANAFSPPAEFPTGAGLFAASSFSGDWRSFFMLGVAVAAGVGGDANAKTWLGYYASDLTHMNSTWGAWHIYQEDQTDGFRAFTNNSTHSIDSNTQWGTAGPDDAHWGIVPHSAGVSLMSNANSFTWGNAASHQFHIDTSLLDGGNSAGYIPTQGDTFLPQDGTNLPGAGFTVRTPYYVLNDISQVGSIYTFSLGATCCSSAGAIASTSSGSMTGRWSFTWAGAIANAPASSGLLSAKANGGSQFLADVRAAILWAKAAASTPSLFNAIEVDANTRTNVNAINLATTTNAGTGASYTGGWQRLMLQDHYGQ